MARRDWKKLRGAGLLTRIMSALAAFFLVFSYLMNRAAMEIAEAIPWFMFTMFLFVTSFRVGVWTSPTRIKFRQTWRSLTFAKEEVSVSSKAFRWPRASHGSAIFSNLVICNGQQSLNLPYTIALNRKVIRLKLAIRKAIEDRA
jgi:O-antigen ligase